MTAIAADVRRRLLGLAYRMLGSVEEAEDVVQDAQLKLLARDSAPAEPEAFLFRVVSNLAVDRLRHLKVQRRHYSGPWLPEPLVTDPADALALSGDLSLGLILVLERLSPAERVAFVLREGFDLSFGEMAEVLGIAADACRQRLQRARRKLDGVRRPVTPPAVQRHLLERLLDTVRSGDVGAVAELLADDAVLLTDGGGKVSAAIRPVERPARIAQVLVHVASREPATDWALTFQPLNGGVGVAVRGPAGGEQGPVYACIALDASDGRISRVYVLRNPDKLGHLAALIGAPQAAPGAVGDGAGVVS